MQLVSIDAVLVEESGVPADEILSRWLLPTDNVPNARRRSLLARALLRRMLVRATGSPPINWTFGAEPSGRPVALNAGHGRVPSISLSHSGGWVAVALSTVGAVGIDIEIHRPDRNFKGISAAAFGLEEQRQVNASGASGFYRIWTLKEAMAKATGLGLAQVADRTDRAAQGPEEGCWYARIGEDAWMLAHAMPLPELSFAMAVRGLYGSQHIGGPVSKPGVDLRAFASLLSDSGSSAFIRDGNQAIFAGCTRASDRPRGPHRDRATRGRET